MANETHYDVIIVGAGPAGCASAIQLSGSGLSVLLLEKSTFPRDKTCGDALSLDVVNQLNWLNPKLAQRFENFAKKTPSFGVRFYAPSREIVDIPFIHKGKNKCGYICSRLDFDNLLFEFVQEETHTEIRQNCKATSVNTNDTIGIVVTDQGKFTSDLIIASDGAHSIVNKQITGQEVDKKHHSAGLRWYYEGVTGFHEDGYIELHYLKDILPGYLWIFPMPNNTANVGIGLLSSEVSKKKINIKEVLDHYVNADPFLRERFKKAKPLETKKGYGLPLGSKKRSLSGNRILLTGDAGSLIDPLSGEGIANAIRSGRFAADHAKICFTQQNFSSSFNLAYDEKLYKAIWNELRVSRALQRMFKYPRFANFLARRTNQSQKLKQFMIEALENVDQKKLLTRPGILYRIWLK